MQTLSPTPLSLLERFNIWLQESVMIKLISIGFLILILLLPASWIQDLIYERQSRATDAYREVAAKWSGPQTIAGPVLVVPYKKYEIIDRGKDDVQRRESIHKAYFLPHELNVNGKVSPQMLNRGIFDVAVYKSQLRISAAFEKPDFDKLSIPQEDVIWKETQLVFGLTDLRGIGDTLQLSINGQLTDMEPSSNTGVTVATSPSNFQTDSYVAAYGNDSPTSTGVTAKLDWHSIDDFVGNVDLNVNLKGSQRLDFVPAGKSTTVSLEGSWKDPSFDGEILPTDRNVTDENFTARWKILHFNRPFPQQWTDENPTLKGSGVKLLIPVDQYQKSMRTSKYGILVILLTFIALFLVEITQKIRIHPFQYILIGVALIIYYTLLLSVSEHTGYNIGYVIASVSTVLLISAYATSFLRSTKLVATFAALLVVFYTFIFVIILQQDFSLLIGSVGLFMIVGCLMYFSRRIKWYDDRNISAKSEVGG